MAGAPERRLSRRVKGSTLKLVVVNESPAPPQPDRDEAAPTPGAYRLVYLAMLFSVTLGLLFASDAIVSYCYDLPANALTDRIVAAAEEWQRTMQDLGLADLAQRVRDFVAALRQ